MWDYAFELLSPIDLEGRPIERGARAVRYSYPESQQTALLAGVRDDGRPVIDGTHGMHVHVKQNTNTYILQNSRDTGMSMYKTGIKISYLDEIIETELLGMLLLSEYVAAHPEESDAAKFVSTWHEKMEEFGQAKQAQSKNVTTPQEDTLETLDGEIALIEQDLEYSAGVMDVKTRTDLYAKKVRLYQRRDKLMQAEANKARTQERLEKARSQVKTAMDRWKSWSLEEKRAFIHIATDWIEMEEIASGWLRISMQWSSVLGGLLYTFYIWRPSGTQWSKDEEALLAEHYPTAKRADLLYLLKKRSWREIGAKAQQMGIHRKHSYDVLPIPADMSLEDMVVLESLQEELTQDEWEDRQELAWGAAMFVHITRVSNQFSLSKLSSQV